MSSGHKLLDLTKKGKTTLYIDSNEEVESVRIISMNGIEVDFFTQTGKKKDEKKDRWEVEIEVNILLRMMQFTAYI